MGYFSNGTEGMDYEDKYCDHCVHGGDCAVWDAHFMFNGDENKKDVLNLLIPRAGTSNLKCKMFIEGNPQYELDFGMEE